MSVTREQLYAEVWAEPMTAVAARYEVSSSFMARVCEDLNVPRPPRGYWAQLKFGKKVVKPALPPVRPGDEVEWLRGEEPQSPRPRALPKPPPPRAHVEALSSPEKSIRKSHPLVIEAQAFYPVGRVTETGFLRPNKKLVPDVYVSQPALERALKLTSQLYIELERRGHRVVIAPSGDHLRRPDLKENFSSDYHRHEERWAPGRPTVVYLGTLAIGLTIYEQRELVEVTSRDPSNFGDWSWVRLSEVPAAQRKPRWQGATPSKREMPNGRLALRVYSPYWLAPWEKTWTEERARDLPGRIPNICDELEAHAPEVSNLIEDGERKHAEEQRQLELQHQKWAREEAERQRAQAHKESKEQLFRVMEAWAQADNIEKFLTNLEAQVAKIDGPEKGDLVGRIELARKMFGNTDALQYLRAWRTPEERVPSIWNNVPEPRGKRS